MSKGLAREKNYIKDSNSSVKLNLSNINTKFGRSQAYIRFHQESETKSFISRKINLSATIKDGFSFLLNEYQELIDDPKFGPNLLAGLTVAAVALPLNLALALAAGLPASVGLLSGAIGGGFAAIFGGARMQATGPAAALNIMVFGIVQQFGVVGAAAAALIAGFIQIILSIISAGSLIRFIPESVLIGFTTGVGIKLVDSQIPKLFGIEWSLYEMIQHFFDPHWLHEVIWPSVVCGLFVLFFILSFRRFQKFPAALLGIAITTYLAVFLKWPIHRVGDIPAIDLSFRIPSLQFNDWLKLLQLAIPLALLSGIESLLSAQAVDRLIGKSHHSNLELFGQGIGNLFSGFFGGMPVSGVIVRSSVGVQAGGTNRLTNFFHSGILLASAIFLGGLLSKVPLASLAGLLCIIGFRLIEFNGFYHLLKSHKLQALGFIFSMAGTISNQIISGIAIGLCLFALDQWLHKKNKPILDESNKVERLNEEGQTESSVFQWIDKGERWLQHLKARAHVPNSSYVHPEATIIGRVILGHNVHIATGAAIRADEGTPFYIGDDTNVQDGVVIHALKKKGVRVQNQEWAVYIGKKVSLAHQALVHGPCYIGDNTFIGFKAVVHDSVIGQGCYVGIGAIVVGVEIPDEKYIPHGALIDSIEKVNNLVRVSPAHGHFNEDVVEVNQGLAKAYHEFDDEKNFVINEIIEQKFTN